MGYNSPYAISDVRVYRNAVEGIQDEIVIRKDEIQLPICKACFYGVHPHGETKNSDCKVILKRMDTGSLTGSQCCCTWREA